MAWSEYTLLRALEYEAIAGLRLPGLTLDVGGGSINSYHKILKIDGRIETVNIDPAVEPTHIVNLNQPLPFPNGVYDNVISLNTFEHIFDDRMAISEALRVLRAGGQFHFIVPFLYRVHSSPHDYHRHTAQWWEWFLLSLGADSANFCIEPLVWDARATAQALHVMRGGVRRAGVLALAFFDPGHWARLLVAIIPFLRERPWRPGASPLSATDRQRVHYEEAAMYALGYYIHGTLLCRGPHQ